MGKPLLRVRQGNFLVEGSVIREYGRPKVAYGWVSVREVRKDPVHELGNLSVGQAEWLEGSINAVLGAIDAELDQAKEEGFRIRRR